MQILNNNKQINDSTRFQADVKNLFSLILTRHNNLMNIWNKENLTEILEGLGTDAQTIFEVSYLLQQALKKADTNYEIKVPHINKTVIEMVEKEVKFINEDGEEKTTIEIVEQIKTESTPVTVIFNQDGSFYELKHL